MLTPHRPARALARLAALLLLSTAHAHPAPHDARADQPDEPMNHHPIRQSPDQLLDGRLHALCYSPFRTGQHPDLGDGASNPTAEHILEDLRLIIDRTPSRLIRVYDAGPNAETLLRVIDDNDLPVRVLLGAWLAAELSNPNCPWMPEPYPDEVLAANKQRNAEEIDRAVRLANAYPDIVAAVAVGNEALVDWTDHLVPLEQVIAYVRSVKARVQQPVTVADNYDWWAKHGEPLARELDFVSVHVYPQWENQPLEQALGYGADNIQRVRDTLPDATLVITEAGWATTAREFGDRASETQQLRYYRELYDWARRMNITTFFFSAFDESWKGDPSAPDGAEKHWGLFFQDRTPKLTVRTLTDDERTPRPTPEDAPADNTDAPDADDPS